MEFIGKNELKKIQTKGITRKLMGIIIETKTINVSGSIELKDKDNNIVGDMREWLDSILDERNLYSIILFYVKINIQSI